MTLLLKLFLLLLIKNKATKFNQNNILKAIQLLLSGKRVGEIAATIGVTRETI